MVAFHKAALDDSSSAVLLEGSYNISHGYEASQRFLDYSSFDMKILYRYL